MCFGGLNRGKDETGARSRDRGPLCALGAARAARRALPATPGRPAAPGGRGRAPRLRLSIALWLPRVRLGLGRPVKDRP